MKTISINQTVAEAFKMMQRENISAIPLKDEQEEKQEECIIGVISLKDIIFLCEDPNSLNFTIDQFIELRDKDRKETRFPVINCKTNDTLTKVFDKFSASKTHRIFVKREDQFVGVLTVRNLLKTFLLESNNIPPLLSSQNLHELIQGLSSA